MFCKISLANTIIILVNFLLQSVVSSVYFAISLVLSYIPLPTGPFVWLFHKMGGDRTNGSR